ncbi:Peritrophin-1, partial [Dufourea novaeangliae]
IVFSGRQNYPTVPTPEVSNELPGPIVTVEPIPPPGCWALRGQFPSSKSCANYLNCWDGVVIEQTCPDGLLFNAVSLVCDYDYNVNCGDRPLPTPKPPLPNGSTLCPDPNGRYRSATNCSEFYVCVFGKPIKFSCPRGLVYNDVLNVCDYPYNVDCKGAATPKPTPPPQTVSPITLPATQAPTYAPPSPSYPSNPPSYSIPWLGSKLSPDPWHQRTAITQSEIEKQEDEQVELQQPEQQSQSQSETPKNPWNLIQNIPASLVSVPCENGDVHRLNDSCTNVVVCRNGRPQLVQCTTGLAYDRSSDSCTLISVAKW